MATEAKLLSGTLPVLYSFRRCPYAMRARLAILSSGIQCELREVVLRNKPTELIAASPKATVPVLLTSNGQVVIEQSWDIMLWALRQHDPADWLPTDPTLFERGMQWLQTCDGEFKHQLDRHKYPQRYDTANASMARVAALPFLMELESQLALQGCLLDNNFGIFDAAILPFIRQFAHVDMDWFAAQALPCVRTWLSAFENSDDFKRVMAVYPAWVNGSCVTVFP